MGLDIYVGPLCRYYAGAWETVVQKWARESGNKVEVVRPSAPEGAITDPVEARPIVDEWREGLSKALQKQGVWFSWPEDPNGEYFTDKPDWETYAALLLWAAYTEHPQLRRPTHVPEDFSKDPALLASRAPGFKTKFPQLLLETEFWLPADFDFVFGAPTPVGDNVRFGSCQRLRAELQRLCRDTWGANPPTVLTWRGDMPARGAPLEEGARFCAGLMLPLAQTAVERTLPMKLDY